MQTQSQFYFLKDYVEALLIKNGLGDITEQQKNIYVPQILGHLEERIGLEMLPKLSKTKITEFSKLLEKENVDPEEWKNFWYKAVPKFEEEIQKILESFAKRVKEILA